MPRRGLKPDEERWIRRLERTLKDQPATLAVFVASGSVCIMLADKNGQMPHLLGADGRDHGEGVDQGEKVAQVWSRNWDGGDW